MTFRGRNKMAAKMERRNSTGNLKDSKPLDRLKREHFLNPDSDQVDLNLLLQAVLDISEKLDRENERKQGDTSSSAATADRTRDFDQRSSVSSTHTRPRSAVRYNEFKKPPPLDRKNMSFSNTRVVDIDRENQRLLRQLSRTRGRPKSATIASRRVFSEPLRVQTASEVNRSRFQRKVDAENQQILQRLQAIRPTRSLSKEHLSKEASAQKHFCKNSSKSRPSSARPSSARPSSARTRTSSESKLSRTASQSSLMTTTSVASSQVSSSSRPSGRRKESSKLVWESGW